MIEIIIILFCVATMVAVALFSFYFKDQDLLQIKFVRYILMGIFNTANNYFFYMMLKPRMHYQIALILAYIISAVIAYFISTYYIFRKKPNLRTVKLYPITFLPGLILNPLLTGILVKNHILGENIAALLVMLIVVPITYLILKVIYSGSNNNE